MHPIRKVIIQVVLMSMTVKHLEIYWMLLIILMRLRL